MKMMKRKYKNNPPFVDLFEQEGDFIDAKWINM
jgi:hypothetical protein